MPAKPRSSRGHLDRGLLLAQAGNHAEAQAALGRALALDPDMPEALEGMALSLLQQHRNREAAAAYARALRSGAGSADTHYNLAVALARVGDREGAVEACREAVRLRPGMKQAQALLQEVGQ